MEDNGFSIKIYIWGDEKMFCRNCGTKLQTGDRFCRGCGASVDLTVNIMDEAGEGKERKAPEAFKSIEEVTITREVVKPHRETIPSKGKSLSPRKLFMVLGAGVLLLVIAGILFGGKLTGSYTARKNIDLGNKYVLEGKYEEAIIAYQKVIKVDPKNIPARMGLGKAYVAQKKYSEGERIFREVIAIDSNAPEPFIEIANIYVSQGELETALDILEEGLSATGHESIKKALDEVIKKLNDMVGNTPGNIQNMGTIAKKGDWVYLSRGEGLYKEKLDGTSRVKVCDDYALFINVVGDYIYYLNEFDNKKLYRIKTDGKGRTKLSDENLYYVNVVGDWVYSCLLPDGDVLNDFVLCKMKTDGTGKTVLSDDSLGNYYSLSPISVSGEWIFYRNASDDYKLYKIKTDGTGRTAFGSGRIGGFNPVGDWVYYSNISDSFKLYKVKTDGTGETKLLDGSVFEINVYGDFVYYLKETGQDRYKICKVKTDGTGNQEVSPEEIVLIGYDGFMPGISVAGDFIYYHDYKGLSEYESAYYRIRTDGTDKQLIE